jgi:glutamate:GABA antiporter
MTLFVFTMITIATIISIRNFPSMALVGWGGITFNILAIVMYLIPAALVAAELATGWPEEGGIYPWAKRAFGEHWGFTAVWLQWFQLTIGFIGILAFIGGTVGYLFAPGLADNKWWVFLIIVVVWWAATAVNLRGIATYARYTTLLAIVGVLIPMVVLIVGGLWWVGSGHHTLIAVVPSLNALSPSFSNVNQLVLLVTFVFFWLGIEVSAAHVNDLKDPGRNYPLTLLAIAVFGLSTIILGGLVVAWIVPVGNLSLIAGIQQTYATMFGPSLSWVVTILGILVVIGAIAEVMAWVYGPIRGLAVAARNGDLPPFLQTVNARGIPTALMILQGLIVTAWGLVFVALPGDVNSAFWELFALATTVYLVMYFIMYAAAIKLRYTEPDTPRKFRVPGGKLGMWIVAGWGIVAMGFVFVVAMVPPSQIPEGTPLTYEAFLVIGTAVVVALPFIIYAMRKPNWKPKGATNPVPAPVIARTEPRDDPTPGIA